MGEIEAAAGLSPRAGGFYRHFRSKRDVLEAGLERYAEQAARSEAALDLLPLADFRSELTLFCRWTLNLLAEMRDFIRILRREGDEFPDLVAKYHERIVRRGLVLATEFFRFKAKEMQLELPDHDPEAIAAVSLGAIVNYRVEEALFGEPPGAVSEERFVKTWVDVWGTYGDNLVRTTRSKEG